jgi:hypothetical protein
MNLDAASIAAIAEAIAASLRPHLLPPGWPEGRGCLTEAETSNYLSIGMDFLRQLRVERRIAHTKIGRRIVYSPANIAEFLGTCHEPRTAHAKIDSQSSETPFAGNHRHGNASPHYIGNGA